MAMTKIDGKVKIGGIYECDFGLFKANQNCLTETTSDAREAVDNDLNYKIPHELIKKRPVIVIGKHRGLSLVVPISTTKETHKKAHKIPENQGIHIKLMATDFPSNVHKYQNNVDMWAKCNLITHIDNGRLTDLRSSSNPRQHLPVFIIPQDTLEKIKMGVLLSIGMQSLLDKIE